MLLLLLILAMATDFRPRPIYPSLVALEGERLELPGAEVGDRLSVEFAAPADNLNAIYWGEFFSSSRQEVEVSLMKAADGRLIGSDVIIPGKLVSRFGGGDNAHGERLRVELRWLADAAPRIPLVPAGKSNGAQDGVSRVRVDGTDLPVVADIRLSEEKPSKERSADAGESSPASTVNDSEWLYLERGREVEIEIAVPSDGLKVISIPGLLSDERCKVRIEILNLTTGEPLAKSLAKEGKAWEKTIDPAAAGDRLLLTLNWDSVKPPAALISSVAATIPLQAEHADGVSTKPPMLLAFYRWSSRGLLWLWPLVAALLLITVRNRRCLPVFLISLGLLASATGMLRWQQQYSAFAGHLDADSYGAYAERLADFVSGGGEESRSELIDWFHDYSNAQVPLVSAIVAMLHLLGLPVSIGYLWLTGLCAFGMLLTTYHMLRHRIGASEVSCLLAVALMTCHLVVLKAFTRPSPDMPGLLLVTLMLSGILWRFKKATPRQTAWLALLPLLLLLTRHGTAAYLPFYVGAILIADIRRQGSGSWFSLTHLRTAMVIGLPAVLIYGAMFLAFDWQHNLVEAMEHNRDDTRFHSAADLGTVLVMLVQFFVLGWMLLPGSLRAKPCLRPGVLLSVLWVGYFFLFMLVIEASFVHRLFLPAIPALVIAFAAGIDRLAECWPKTVTAGVIVACACNIAVTVHVIYLPYLPPVTISRFIY